MAFTLNARSRAFTAARDASAPRLPVPGRVVRACSAAEDTQKAAMEEQMRKAMEDPAMQEKMKVRRE